MFFLISSVLLGSIALYVIVRVIWQLRCSLWLRCLFSLLLLAAAEKIVLLRLLLGPTAQQNLSEPTVFIMGFAQGFVVLTAMLTLLRDLLLLLRWLWRKLKKRNFRTAPQRSPSTPWCLQAMPIVILSFVLTGWSVWQAAAVPQVRQIQLQIPNLPAGLEGFRIVQLSDLHMGPGFNTPWLTEVVQRANALKPDMVAITGDIVDGSVPALRSRVAPLLQLRSHYGTFLVAGNHEYYSGLDSWMREFDAMGLQVLENSHLTLDVNNTPLVVAGITDPVATQMGAEPPNAVKALEGRPKDAFTLMLAHQPRTANANAAAGVQVQLSGHTHGGLMIFLQPLVALFNDDFVAGIYTRNGMQVYVHHGSGLWAGFPVRLGVPSEITCITLRRAS